MKDEKISIGTAKLAQSKGFDLKEPCDCGGYPECICEAAHSRIPDYIYLPTQALLQRWLREKYNFNIWIDCSDSDKWIWTINFMNKGDYIQSDDNGISFKTYEQALEAGLQEALNLIK